MPRILRPCVSRLCQQKISAQSKISVFLIPSPLLAPSILGSTHHRRSRFRSYATVVKYFSDPFNSNEQRVGSSDRAFTLGQGVIGSSSNSEQWLAALEAYIPTALRYPTSSPVLNIRSRFAFAVPNLLSQARGQSNIDLLSYLGVEQGRWKAVHWLVLNLIRPVTAGAAEFDATPLRSQMHLKRNIPLDDVTQGSVWAEHDVKSKRLKNTKPSSLRDLTGKAARSSGMSDSAGNLALRQIWQSIGMMILQAADSPIDKSRTVMSNVHQIIAYLHQVNVVPDTIYNYPYATDPSVPQRPPTLYLLSARILTTLSDAVWRAQEEAISMEVAAVGAQFPYKGYGSPSLRYTPRVRDLGHAVWIEFVLWSCVESGYVAEGAWILNKMGRRRGDGRWSTIQWSALQESRSEETPRELREGWFGFTSLKNKVIGINEGYSVTEPLVEMGPRTISTEAVVAVIDGLLSTVRVGFGSTGNTPGQVQKHIYSLKAILERDNFRLPPRTWNSVIVRLLESEEMDPEMGPASLERVLALAPTTLRNCNIGGLQADSESVPSVVDNVFIQSDAMLGLLYRTLHAFALQGNIRGARRVYRRIQSYIIDWRTDTDSTVTTNLRRSMHAGDENIYFDAEASDITDYFPDVPEPVLAAFIDLITDSKTYDFGRWLLYSDETGSPVARFFSSVTVAPALLRFAAATADTDLLNKVISALVVPLPESIIRTMFHCHIALSDWDGVQKLLSYFKEERKLGWSAVEVAALARAVMILDNAAPVNTDSFNKAKFILRRLLTGHYNTTQLAYRRRDNSQVDLLGQFIRIFRTIPGALSELCQDLPNHDAQPLRTVEIPVNAFNILLDAVVGKNGSLEGRRMWHRWCREPAIKSRNWQAHGRDPVPPWARPAVIAVSVNDHGPEQFEPRRVIQPNLTTLRTILQAAVAERRVSTEVAARYFGNSPDEPGSEHLPTYRAYRPTDTLDWGSGLLRRFGLRETSIDVELGGYLYRQKRPFVREGQTLARKGQRLNKKIRSSARYNRFLAGKSEQLTGENSEPNHPRPDR